ncbi:MAG: nucleotidyltransferase domain-containing protein [Oscillospiraceae bacterium]|nr:nucleotidyltransferase domain-containing protein [Oscillospiraceae bacterium]
MCKSELDLMLNNFLQNAKKTFGDKLVDIILYGSYARGDYDKESDIDVMLLMDIPSEETDDYIRPVVRIANEAGWNSDSYISSNVTSYAHFEKYKEALPFYKNVINEGVRLIAR